MESVDRNTTAAPSGKGDAGRAGRSDSNRAAIPAAANACLALSLAGGAGLLVWWSVVCHPNGEQLWMVPVSLVMVGTPLMIWLSVSRPSSCCFSSPPESAIVLPDPEK